MSLSFGVNEWLQNLPSARTVCVRHQYYCRTHPAACTLHPATCNLQLATHNRNFSFFAYAVSSQMSNIACLYKNVQNPSHEQDQSCESRCGA